MIYGYYYKTINKGPTLPDDTCPGCGSKGTLRLNIICKVSHWIYIPCWPSNKQPVLECSMCQEKYKTDALPHLYPKDQELLKRTGYRFYHFAGLILLLLFVGLFACLVISGEKEKMEKIHRGIETLDEGVVINYKLPDKQETSMYVDSVRGDSVWVRENRMATTGQVMHINTSENYSDEPTLYLKEELHKLADEERIIEIYITAAYVRKQIEQENENIQN